MQELSSLSHHIDQLSPQNPLYGSPLAIANLRVPDTEETKVVVIPDVLAVVVGAFKAMLQSSAKDGSEPGTIFISTCAINGSVVLKRIDSYV